jgi:flavin reductase (DIM6/NTAB) family NADH-FMN oxidoreductase RutF
MGFKIHQKATTTFHRKAMGDLMFAELSSKNCSKVHREMINMRKYEGKFYIVVTQCEAKQSLYIASWFVSVYW